MTRATGASDLHCAGAYPHLVSMPVHCVRAVFVWYHTFYILAVVVLSCAPQAVQLAQGKVKGRRGMV